MNNLTIIIPAWQAEKYIEEAVATVRSQSWDGKREIIVCDDGSTDQTASKAEELGCKVLRLEHGGAAKARNAGLEAAAYDYVYFLDADDRVAEQGLEKLIRAMEETGADAVFGKAEDFISEELTAEQKAGLAPRTGSYGGVLPGCALLKKRIFAQTGVFDCSLKSGETVAWMMKLRDANIKSVQIEETVLHRRLHMTNTGRLFKEDERKNYAAILRARMKKK